MHTGDHVRIHAGGVTVFEIVELDDTHAVLTPAGTGADAPGAYPFRIPAAALVPVGTTDEH